MVAQKALEQRSNNTCELCTATDNLAVFPVPPISDLSAQQSILVCEMCLEQIEGKVDLDVNHWRCLTDSMWNQEPAVQVISYRMLHKLSAESWAQDALDMIYMEDDVKTWAEQGIAAAEREGPTRDSNGAELQDGDDVTLIKDLKVKGANFTAKQGTLVRGISLTDNLEHIEGKVNGTRIVLVASYLKKA
ncbi:PhnA domain-containing protein [Pseudocolwellia sp. AS88]|uniref:PhnA domain-containing protein n=1 Tax=Pseudocolwellia sp. AS88 TaxID=3063958 RepID=UPI0026F109CD|nr:alkylphosphonate utilization protein [Pseudocolwellia sp. AS88]MDO7083290.1 PhnA domain-containing protein [Pseudocolwellia sp. AS88]